MNGILLAFMITILIGQNFIIIILLNKIIKGPTVKFIDFKKVQLNYVNELQNIYHALFKGELTFKDL